jgi:hypothetical protein
MTSVLADPIAVEFPHAGGWYPGLLLGWRHEGPHDCRIRVQCVIGGLRRTTWMTLADLRLPQPAPRREDDVPPRLQWPSVPSYTAPRPRTGDWALTPA